MATTITLRTIENTSRRLVVVANLNEDGVGATDAILVDKSTFTGPNGLEPGRLVVEQVDYAIDGFNLLLEFDHTADHAFANLAGTGLIDFTKDGMFQGYVDPTPADGTGDIIVTTTGHTAGDKATLVFYLRKKD